MTFLLAFSISFWVGAPFRCIPTVLVCFSTCLRTLNWNSFLVTGSRRLLPEGTVSSLTSAWRNGYWKIYDMTTGVSANYWKGSMLLAIPKKILDRIYAFFVTFLTSSATLLFSTKKVSSWIRTHPWIKIWLLVKFTRWAKANHLAVLTCQPRWRLLLNNIWLVIARRNDLREPAQVSCHIDAPGNRLRHINQY